MSTLSPWIAYYESLPDGRFRITDENLRAMEAGHADRVLFTKLSDKTELVLLLDLPLWVAEKVVGFNAYYLRCIRLVDLPGWPPSISPMGERTRFAGLKGCRLKSARFIMGSTTGQEKLEITLEYQGETLKAWHVGCPASLLKCAEATLNQASALGQKVADLQGMRLVGESTEGK